MSNDHKIDEQYATESWDKMSILLDKEMPVEKKRRKALFFLLPFLALVLLGLGIFYVLDTNIANQEIVNAEDLIPTRVSISQDAESLSVETEEVVAQTAEMASLKSTSLESQDRVTHQVTTQGEVPQAPKDRTTAGSDNSKSITQFVKPQINKKSITPLNSDDLERRIVQTPVVSTKDVVQTAQDKLINQHEAIVKEIITENKVTEDMGKNRDHTLKTPAANNEGSSVFNEKILLENIAGLKPQLVLLKEGPVKNINEIKGTLVECCPRYRRNTLYLSASGIYGFHDDFAGAQVRLIYDRGIYKSWMLNSSIGYTSWLKRVSNSDNDLIEPSVAPENSFASVISSMRFMDVHASIGLAYKQNKLKVGMGLRYRRFFNKDYVYSVDSAMDNNGIGLNDEEFKNQVEQRIRNDEKDLLSAYIGMNYNFFSRYSLGLETEFSKRQLDINGIEQRPFFISGSLKYRF